jgi:hypothetical protein
MPRAQCLADPYDTNLWGVSRRGEHVHAAGVVQGQSRVIAHLVPAAAVLELEGARAIDGAVT